MSIALATRGIISGFMGTTGDVVYVDVPVDHIPASSTEVGNLMLDVKDMEQIAPPQPDNWEDLIPNRKSTQTILPTRNTFQLPKNI